MENVGQGQWTYRVLSDGGLTDACKKKKKSAHCRHQAGLLRTIAFIIDLIVSYFFQILIIRL